ncbi:hypothetical protein L345_16494, partial [Ophiophagus hannah]
MNERQNGWKEGKKGCREGGKEGKKEKGSGREEEKGKEGRKEVDPSHMTKEYYRLVSDLSVSVLLLRRSNCLVDSLCQRLIQLNAKPQGGFGGRGSVSCAGRESDQAGMKRDRSRMPRKDALDLRQGNRQGRVSEESPASCCCGLGQGIPWAWLVHRPSLRPQPSFPGLKHTKNGCRSWERLL